MITFLLSIPSGFDNVFPLLRRERRMVSARCAEDRRHAVAVRVAAPSIVGRVLHSWRQAAEVRRARRQLMQFDDRLLKDIGLTRIDVQFGDFETLGRHRRAGGIR